MKRAGRWLGAALTLALAGCATQGPQEQAGMVIGGVRSGVPSQWRNLDSGNQYRVTPTRTYETAQGPCREYTVDGLIGGKRETMVGTACRQADGSWRVMN
jgi:hypothetical protein